jgi:hypothetical protein
MSLKHSWYLSRNCNNIKTNCEITNFRVCLKTGVSCCRSPHHVYFRKLYTRSICRSGSVACHTVTSSANSERDQGSMTKSRSRKRKQKGDKKNREQWQPQLPRMRWVYVYDWKRNTGAEWIHYCLCHQWYYNRRENCAQSSEEACMLTVRRSTCIMRRTVTLF